MRNTNTRRKRAVVGGLALATIITGSATTVASATTALPAPRNAVLAAPAAAQDEPSRAAGAAPAKPSNAGQNWKATEVAALATPTDCHTPGSRMCFFWDRNLFGNNSSSAGFGVNVWDHMYYRFPYPGRGGGQRIGNNAGSFWNFASQSVTVYYNPSRNGARPSGPSQVYYWNQNRTCAQAGPLICNNNRSHFFS